MTTEAERVPVACPGCSPDLETVHEVLTTGGGRATVQCSECGHTHKVPIEAERTVEREVVVSQDGESFTATVEVDAEETVRTGDEFILETEEAIMQVRITDLEVGPEDRTSFAAAADVETFWTRAVDNVTVPVTVHPKGGEHDQTTSLDLQLPGDYEFTIGEVEAFGDREFEVEGIHVRQEVVGDYKFQKLGHEGDVVEAKDVKRVYGTDTKKKPWSAW
jgi:uncharacterized Zn finger protein